MTYPAVLLSQVTDGTSAGDPANVGMPIGSNIAAKGQLNMILLRTQGAQTHTWPSGWTTLFNASSDAADDVMSLAYHFGDGTITDNNIAIDLSASAKYASIAWTIGGAQNPAVQAPQLSTVATGSATEPNATTCTPSGGAKDYLWLTIMGMEGEQTGITSYPSGYANGHFSTSGTGGAVATNCTVAGAYKQANAASDDAGVWNVTGTLDDWTAYTVVIHPGDDLLRRGYGVQTAVPDSYTW